MKKLCLFLFLLGGISPGYGQQGDGYQVPPQSIADLVNAPQTPSVSVNNQGNWMILLENPGYVSVRELARPELRLAGLRINPANNGSSRGYSYSGLKARNLTTNEDIEISGLPDPLLLQNIQWSPDGQRVAFTQHEDHAIHLWVADLQRGEAWKATELAVNDAIGSPFDWLNDNETLLVKTIPANRGSAPVRNATPDGPVIQETSGTGAPVRTYQDLLGDAHDEALFSYYTTSQLHQINIAENSATAFGEEGIISSVSVSPDGKYTMVEYIHEPFSYIVPYYRFPFDVKILDNEGEHVSTIARIPLSEEIPKGFDATREGPRSFTWRADVPSTLYWVEAQDGGDPAVESKIRDQLFYLEAPFRDEKKPDVTSRLRVRYIQWGDDELALVHSRRWTDRQVDVNRFVPGKPDSRQVVFSYSSEDSYNDPGNFEMTRNEYGKSVLLRDRNNLFLTGRGASPEGDRPFLRSFDIRNGKTEELWRSQAPYYEYVVQVIDPRGMKILTRKESKEMPPNYFMHDLKKGSSDQLTQFDNPYESLAGIEKEVIRYKRADGIDLTGNLYLPKGYNPETDGALPVLMWAYPDEYKSAAAASQVKGSPYRFIRLYWGSPLYWLTRGYAILDDPGMPVIGEGDAEPNDSFRKQLVMNAEAAIDKLADMGVGDRNRVAIGGHSYGAFMTANLLAHSDLFAAGIARSGAYNRTLTPFGFQAEERTYWEAPEVYYTMSPFMHADKINEPMLMIHGMADNNSGTFPIQSERMFAAIKGLGGQARLVMLPYESHGYRARESILHTLWEMDQLLETYVKNRKTPDMNVESK